MSTITPKLSVALRAATAGLATLTVAACSDDPVAPRGAEAGAVPQQRSQVIPDQYVVMFNADVPDPATLAASLAKTHGGKVHFTYTTAIKGFAATLPQAAVDALRHNPHVAAVEADALVRAEATQTMDGLGHPWGIDRIDEQDLPLSGTYTYTKTGSGVYAYIIDTGLQANHSQFTIPLLLTSRAKNVFDAYGGTGADCNGHGTHVAGTVGGKTYGVAKSVKLRGVRVIGGTCGNTGPTSYVIAGVDWVAKNHAKPAVANMSLGGPKSLALDAAVKGLVSAGVFVSVSAGNSGLDACNFSPANLGTTNGVFSTAASTKTDARAKFVNWASNYGACVDGYAPGANIKSAFLNNGTAILSGTSMASPHVAGVAALLLQGNPGWAPVSTETWIKWAATPNKISGNVGATPNRLLYKGTI